MGSEEVLNLFDSCWFALEILKKQSQTSNYETNTDRKNQESPSEPKFSSLTKIFVMKSESDQFSSMKSFTCDYSLSPNSALFTPIEDHGIQRPQNSLCNSRIVCLESPVSSCCSDLGGHGVLEIGDQGFVEGQNHKKSTGIRRSELELEELKGFMDLGFVFSKEDVNPCLVEIIPGLQILGKNDGGDESEKEEEETSFGKSSVQRPYLSEVWGDVLDRRMIKMEQENPLMNWRIPDLGNELGMKDSLKWWAQTVASTVR